MSSATAFGSARSQEQASFVGLVGGVVVVVTTALGLIGLGAAAS